jgi:hypothetical protein
MTRDKKAYKTAKECFDVYWNDADAQAVLDRAIELVNRSLEEGDNIGMQARLIIMLVPAVVVKNGIAGIKEYFDELKEMGKFVYKYDEDNWHDSMASMLESHRFLIANAKEKPLTPRGAETMLRYLLIESDNYLEAAMNVAYTESVAFIVPLQLIASRTGVALSSLLTVNKTMYAAMSRSEKSSEIMANIGVKSAQVDTYMDFVALLWSYKVALASGFIQHKYAVKIENMLNGGDEKDDDIKTKLPPGAVMEFPHHDTGGIDFGNN